MASTSSRALTLLSLLSAGGVIGAADLADRLEVSERTVRRDVDTLRELGYRIEPVKGSGGGYRLGADTRLPPLLFDEEQVVAIAVALQTAPAVLAGIGESAARALQTVRRVMPERLRGESDAFTVTTLANYWEFPAPPISADLVRDVGAAVRRRHVLRAEYRDDDGSPVRVRVEPHRLVVWAARWYLVAFDLESARWRVLRLDRLTAKSPTWVPFDERPLPTSDVGEFVQRAFDRGDMLAPWPCQGSVVLDVPPATAAMFAPGGAVVEFVSDRSCLLRMGAWSWTGLAGLYLTFAADMRQVEPAELRQAFAGIVRRLDEPSPPPG
ncbi:helix-turn-helix transcriptional regulator [Microbacterium invictum]|uniref:WYL domain-containing protein n=1 Tax=Microbacterium invictum TaxID=515415 RepID=A0ABZ0V995_9MICO|nr:WYL domain-containing protein [Microbacterium invictum]WQB70197.1 WYL domain-containing protein [Microbacterium invictum]